MRGKTPSSKNHQDGSPIPHCCTLSTLAKKNILFSRFFTIIWDTVSYIKIITTTTTSSFKVVHVGNSSTNNQYKSQLNHSPDFHSSTKHIGVLEACLPDKMLEMWKEHFSV